MWVDRRGLKWFERIVGSCKRFNKAFNECRARTIRRANPSHRSVWVMFCFKKACYVSKCTCDRPGFRYRVYQQRVQATDAESCLSDTKAETAHNEMDAYSAHGANDEHPVENVKVKVAKLSGGGVASFNVDGSATVAVLRRKVLQSEAFLPSCAFTLLVDDLELNGNKDTDALTLAAAGIWDGTMLSLVTYRRSKLFVSGGIDHRIGMYLEGFYDVECLNHDRPVYKREGPGDVIYIYYWNDDTGLPSNAWSDNGWWIGPEVGGETVCMRNVREGVGTYPPEFGWEVLVDGTVDDAFAVLQTDAFQCSLDEIATAFFRPAA